MGNLYGSVKHGDEISPAWMQSVEDGLGGGGTTTLHPALAADYIIWVSDSTYYSRDGRTGEVDSDTVWADLMNDRILDLYNSAAGTGGTIGMLGGAYSATKSVNERPGVHIYGNGRCGHDASYDRLGTIITATGDFPIFKFDNPDSSALYHQGLHHMWLEGDSKITSSGVVDVNPSSYNLADIFLEDLSIVNALNGIRVLNSTAAKSVWNIFVERCFIESCTDAGLLIESSTDQKIAQNRICRNHFYNNNTSTGNGAIEIDGHECRGSVISGNTFELEQRNAIYMADEAWGWALNNNIIIDASQATDNTYSGIKLVDVDFISVNGNVVKTKANTYMKYGYEADNSCTYLAVLGNVFVGQTAGASFGTGTGNIGDATMNVVKTA